MKKQSKWYQIDSKKYLVQEWSPNNIFSIDDVSRGSMKIINWVCSQGHEWSSAFYSRFGLGSGCPFCSGRNPTHEKQLLVCFPQLKDEWDFQKNTINPNIVSSGSSRLVNWVCKNNPNHTWRTSVINRTKANYPTGCPFCSGKKADENTNILKKFPILIKNEFDYAKNQDIDVKTILPKSHKSVWWICKNNHSWKATFASRTNSKSGCPHCSIGKNISKWELRVFSELKIIFPDIKHNVKIHKDSVDLYIKSLSLAIEIDGYRWHKNKVSSDKRKIKRLKKLGIKTIRARECPLIKIQKNDVSLEKREFYTNKCIIEIVNQINNLFKTNYHISYKNKMGWINADLYKILINKYY